MFCFFFFFGNAPAVRLVGILLGGLVEIKLRGVFNTVEFRSEGWWIECKPSYKIYRVVLKRERYL